MSRLLLGANGQLGQHLRARANDLATCARNCADHACDLADQSALVSLLDSLRPSVIVNAAAYTAVDDAETNGEAAYRLNRDLPAWLAAWCRDNDALLVHYSTDYVFSGQPGRPWREDDPVAPESVYGASKLAGEQAIISTDCRALILRTAWVYSALPGNFLSAILGRAARGQSLKVVSDQVGSPTWAGSLADATLVLLERAAERVERPELMHVAGQGAMSWHKLALEAVQMAAGRGMINHEVDVEPISSDQWPQKAKRPAWSVLDGRRYEQWTGRPLPDARAALAECLDQWRDVACSFP
ncbi:dTDP-4-dehydrorhamnose reductase [Wenzhouxiangella sp. AB-CW3]|uniref:dTDP-4-dehydrorhamnose reductase n=1 Tax=Wenzhouxiangella sp. AB-CW3 TaxID=2771012 RepID=UPI00168A43DD|nr:dTDP-4-dehydrorhamnose reductase [Wenzhouxiangella sp. AB-CW3]QOC23600.1 dTDP-4-dehydrorhamnose reductase [Wenzhouxiangella sp. AB-CW3]